MIPFGNEQPQRPEEKGPFVFRLYVVDEGPQFSASHGQPQRNLQKPSAR